MRGMGKGIWDFEEGPIAQEGGLNGEWRGWSSSRAVSSSIFLWGSRGVGAGVFGEGRGRSGGLLYALEGLIYRYRSFYRVRGREVR